MSAAFGTRLFESLRKGLEGVVRLVGLLLSALAYAIRRPPRGPGGRVGLKDVAEGIAIGALVLGLIAAAMILLDPYLMNLSPHLPKVVVQVFRRITDLGLGGVVLWPLGLALLGVLAFSTRLRGISRAVAASVAVRLGFLFFSVATIGLLVSILKRLLGRARPHMALSAAGENAQLTFHWLGWKSSFASFPSGHSTTAFAAAVAFGALYPRARTPLLVLAALIAISRIVLSSHFPSDVIAGAAFGTVFVLGLVKFLAARRLVFAVDGEGHVYPMAGPSARRVARLLGAARKPDTPRSLEEARP